MNRTNPMPTPRDDFIPTRWTLIQRLKNWDDQEGWREFFDTYWRLIYGTALKSGLTETEAQEVVQETVITVCRNIHEFKATPEAGSFKGWLHKLTRWRIIDQVRKRRPSDAPRGLAETDSGTAAIDRLPDPAGLDLEKVWNEEWADNLTAAALERVQQQSSARHYQIFYLYVIRETAVETVAQVTGVSANEVYLVKHRLLPLFDKAVRAIDSHEP